MTQLLRSLLLDKIGDSMYQKVLRCENEGATWHMTDEEVRLVRHDNILMLAVTIDSLVSLL